jgi:hypothetical protein
MSGVQFGRVPTRSITFCLREQVTSNWCDSCVGREGSRFGRSDGVTAQIAILAFLPH